MKPFVFFLLLLLFLPVINAVPPVLKANNFDTGYLIKFPLIDNIKLNTTTTFNFHVFNLTDGVPINSGITCYFHLYNSTGNHVYTKHDVTTTDHTFDYNIKVNGNNFSTIGGYGYVFQCNSSKLGGYVEEPLEVTASGFGYTPTNNVGIYFVLVLAVLFFVGFIFIDKDVFKWSFFLMFIFFSMIGINLASLTIYNELGDTSLGAIFDQLSAISIIVYWFIFGLLITIWILTALASVANRKNMKMAEDIGSSTNFKFK